MAVTQRGAATTGANPNGVYVTATKPVGVKNGDVLVAAVVSNNQSMPAPSGWVKFEDDAIDVFRTQLFYKVAGGFEPSEYTFGNLTNSSPLTLSITAWAGVDTTTPIGGSVQTATLGNQSEPMATPSVSSACTDGRVLYFRAARRTDSPPGSPLTYTSLLKAELADSGVFSGGTVSYSIATYADLEDFSEAGTKAGAEISASGAETHNVVGTVLLNAAPRVQHYVVRRFTDLVTVQPQDTYQYDVPDPEAQSITSAWVTEVDSQAMLAPDGWGQFGEYESVTSVSWMNREASEVQYVVTVLYLVPVDPKRLAGSGA